MFVLAPSRRLGAALSIGLHASLVLAIWLAATREAPGGQSSTWHSPDRSTLDGEGRGHLFDILAAPDVRRVLLGAPLPRGRAKGLAWFSPSHGIWLAVDDLVSSSGDRAFQLTARVAGRQPIGLGTVRVDPDGSGRMASFGAWINALPSGGPLVFTVSDASGDVRLTGSVSVDSPRR